MLIWGICPCIANHTKSNSSACKIAGNNMERNESPSSVFAENENTGNPSPVSPSKSLFGKVVLGITGTVAVALVAITTPFVTPALRRVCLPYVPATDQQIVNVLQMCRPIANSTSQSLVDLGSGDGRVVIAAAKRGYKSHGIELNAWLVWYSKIQAKWHGVSHLATFSRQNLWKSDLAGYNNIVIFGVSEMMDQLQVKIENEVNVESHVIACRFPFSWKSSNSIQDGIDSVWLYKKPFILPLKQA